VKLQPRENTTFKFSGINHLALVCKDMKRTVDFYEGVLGMPLVKTIDLPNGMGQHFFFDIGNGDSLAFFWFPDAPEAVPGISAPKYKVGEGEILSAHGSMNHVAFDVPEELFEEYHAKAKALGLKPTPIINHDDSPAQISRTLHPGVFVRSFYFQDPDGMLLEFATWTRAFTADDVKHAPATAADASKAVKHEDRELAGVR
jgi:catechol 2,3-dioxygenase-like lactoylglutathione lyase family enzyme